MHADSYGICRVIGLRGCGQPSLVCQQSSGFRVRSSGLVAFRPNTEPHTPRSSSQISPQTEATDPKPRTLTPKPETVNPNPTVSLFRSVSQRVLIYSRYGIIAPNHSTVHGSNFGVRRATLKPELEHGNQIWSQGWEHKAAQQVI